MSRIFFTSLSGHCQAVDAQVGATVLEAAKANGIALAGTCGGSMVCATCHIYVDSEFQSQLPAPSEDEEATLDLAFAVSEGSRLGCQIHITELMDGMHVRLAPTMMGAEASR
ncbi:MAG: 2Fe-2S iron-sulfur cluster-binding protein [Burkholderiaceae bacterium]|nr:2Fe-2S iron-sulfur cluster-binding protein [Burkholderiaceae bacterium]